MKPLSGKRVLVTRANHQTKELVQLILQKGGEPITIPLIKTIPPEDEQTVAELRRTLQSLAQFNWIIFTSTNGVKYFFEYLKKYNIQADIIANMCLAAVGPKTALSLEKRGYRIDLVPEQYVGEGLLQSLKKKLKPDDHVLLPRARIARKKLPDELRQYGIKVTEAVVYDTVMNVEQKEKLHTLFQSEKIDIVTFTSPSTVRTFISLLDGLNLQELLTNVKLAYIGPITAGEANKLGLKVDVVAKNYTITGLIEAVCEMN